MGTLYIFEPDVTLHQDSGEVKVMRKRDVLARRPLGHVSDVVIYSNAHVTSYLTRTLLAQQCSIHYVTPTGSYYAHVTPLENKNVPMRIRQTAVYLEPGCKHDLAKGFVRGKIQNSITFAKRIYKGEGAWPSGIGELERVLGQVDQCEETTSLRGLEGNASRHYYELIRPKFPEEFSFESRNKRPPRDRTNSLLSLAYTFLAKEMQTAIRVAGLDPYVGYLHEAKYGRPALALDLMEEFRSIIADGVVLKILHKNMITPEHFHVEEGVPKLTKEGMQQFLRAWEERLQQSARHPLLKQKLHYRAIMTAQARILGKVLMGDIPKYVPYTVR